MRAEVSSSVEEYLEAIYRLQEKHGSARTKDLAEMMEVALGTVTNTVAMLKRRGFVLREPYRGAKLTEIGQKIALGVLRRHRLAERLATDILRLSWSKAHEVGCKLEHALDDETLKALNKALGHPKTCPHGNAIPTGCGVVVEEETTPLSNLKPQGSGTIVKIAQESRDLLQYLESVRLVPGGEVEVERKASVDGSMTVKVADTRLSLSRDVSSVIWVRR
jgi:DtxR family Mn-dependent transcriptional regulator